MNGPCGVRLALSVMALATVSAGRAEIGTETSLGYTDNIDRIETGGRSEQLLAAMLGGQAGQPYGELERHVLWQLGAINYLGDTYDDEVIALSRRGRRLRLARAPCIVASRGSTRPAIA